MSGNDKKREFAEDFGNKMLYLETRYIRPLKKASYECMANCYSNPSASSDSINTCVKGCNLTLDQVNKYIATEVNNYQESIGNCIDQCQAQANDKLTPRSTEPEMTVMAKWFDSCAEKCVGNGLAQLPQFMKHVENVLQARRNVAPPTNHPSIFRK